MLTNTSSDFDLTIRQQPDRARVAGGKEKGMLFYLVSATSASVRPACSALSALAKTRGRRGASGRFDPGGVERGLEAVESREHSH